MPMVINRLAGRLGYQAVIADRARLDVADEGEGGFYIIYRPRTAMSPEILDLSARMDSLSVDVEDSHATAIVANVAGDLAQALEDLVVESDLMEPDPNAPEPEPGEDVKLIPLDFHYARLVKIDVFTLVALFSAIMKDSGGQMSKPAGTR